MMDVLKLTAGIEKLGGDNWEDWKFQVNLILDSRDVWEVVSGDKPKPILPEGAIYEEIQNAYDKELAEWVNLIKLRA